MKNIIPEISRLLENSQFDWAVCGGFAIDLFVGNCTRDHQDLDITAFWEDRSSVIGFMLNANWRVFEACGGGRIHELLAGSDSTGARRNLFCFPSGNTRCQLAHIEGDSYQFSLASEAQQDLDYVEFLFCERDADFLYYARNKCIKREAGKAIIDLDGTAILTPEIVLLYKSTFCGYLEATDIRTNDSIRSHRHDFAVSLPSMNQEQRLWLKEALETEYPNGHEWLQQLSSNT